jgi:hypothetical protein
MPTRLAVDAAALVRDALGADPGEPGPFEQGPLPPPSREVAAWQDEQVLEGLITLEALARHVDAWRVALAAQVEERSARSVGSAGLAARLGCRNARELLRRVTGAAGSTVGAWLRLGRATQEAVGLTGQPLAADFPLVASALAQGRLGQEAALRIVDSLNPVRSVAGEAAVAVAEEELVGACASTEPGGVCPADADSVRIQANTWAGFLDQDGTAPPEADVARRSLRLGGVHRGLVRVNGLLLPEVAAALRAFADASTNPRTPDVAMPGSATGRAREAGAGAGAGLADGEGAGAGPADCDSAGAGPADCDSAGPEPADGEGAGARQADGDDGGAAGAGTQAGAGNAPHTGGPWQSGRTSPGGPADLPELRTNPQLMHDVLASALGAAARVADQRSLAGNSPTVLVAVRQSDLANGRGTAAAFTGDAFGAPAAISIDAARQLACAGAVQRVALDDLGAVVGLGSAERCFTGQQRRAIALRDGGCVIPGCHVPASWCEVHHVTPHAAEGDTHVDNGCLLCWFHHRTIETSGWDIRMRSGVPQVRAPAWLRAPSRPGSDQPDDDGWRRATGSPTRFLEMLDTGQRARAG